MLLNAGEYLTKVMQKFSLSVQVFYVVVKMGLAWSDNPESYTGGSVASCRACHAKQVKGDDPDKEESFLRNPKNMKLDDILATT
jgi:hypothetical protein